MTNLTKDITLDVSRPNALPPLFAKQEDSGTRFLRVRVTDDGTPFPLPQSARVTVNALREDGEAAAFEGEITEDGSATLPRTARLTTHPFAFTICCPMKTGYERSAL